METPLYVPKFFIKRCREVRVLVPQGLFRARTEFRAAKKVPNIPALQIALIHGLRTCWLLLDDRDDLEIERIAAEEWWKDNVQGGSSQNKRTSQRRNVRARHFSIIMVQKIRALLILGYIQAIGAEGFSRQDWLPLKPYIDEYLALGLSKNPDVAKVSYCEGIRKKLVRLKTGDYDWHLHAARNYFDEVMSIVNPT